MKKIEYINLGGHPLAINLDAYHKLSAYLDSLNRYFGKSKYSEEIIGDIELRLSELIQESMGSRKIAELQDVEYSIKTMGHPEEFEASDDGEESESGNKKYFAEDDSAGAGERTYKRKLYRDPEEKIIGGVCSGLSAYFDVSDPLWIRLAFVIFTITGGAGILIYLILWAIVPSAESSIDRLRMHGEPIDLRNFEKMMEDGIDQITTMADKVAKKFTKKKD